MAPGRLREIREARAPAHGWRRHARQLLNWGGRGSAVVAVGLRRPRRPALRRPLPRRELRRPGARAAPRTRRRRGRRAVRRGAGARPLAGRGTTSPDARRSPGRGRRGRRARGAGRRSGRAGAPSWTIPLQLTVQLRACAPGPAGAAATAGRPGFLVGADPRPGPHRPAGRPPGVPRHRRARCRSCATPRASRSSTTAANALRTSTSQSGCTRRAGPVLFTASSPTWATDQARREPEPTAAKDSAACVPRTSRSGSPTRASPWSTSCPPLLHDVALVERLAVLGEEAVGQLVERGDARVGEPLLEVGSRSRRALRGCSRGRAPARAARVGRHVGGREQREPARLVLHDREVLVAQHVAQSSSCETVAGSRTTGSGTAVPRNPGRSPGGRRGPGRGSARRSPRRRPPPRRRRRGRSGRARRAAAR